MAGLIKDSVSRPKIWCRSSASVSERPSGEDRRIGTASSREGCTIWYGAPSWIATLVRSAS
ncbi:Uncharacterised protein [Mycobacteroides abscessus subsp. abscessus]|nr:Uncharacterised protein [Mycobacteroides abscessus subsp. abscessus]